MSVGARPSAAVGTVVLATVVLGGLLVWAYRATGPASVAFALAVVWLPMIWLGIVSRFVPVRLPPGFHRLRRSEGDGGRVYEILGVRVAKRILRRGLLATFNPHLHLPTEPDAARIAALDRRMQDAEASHAVLFVIGVVVALHAAVHGWFLAAGATVVFDVLLNGYPVMLQRYNRALLARRYPAAHLDA